MVRSLSYASGVRTCGTFVRTLLTIEFCRWDIVAQDWFSGVEPNVHYDIRPDTFDTARPRNFSDDDLEQGEPKLAPRPPHVLYVLLGAIHAQKRFHVDTAR